MLLDFLFIVISMGSWIYGLYLAGKVRMFLFVIRSVVCSFSPPVLLLFFHLLRRVIFPAHSGESARISGGKQPDTIWLPTDFRCF